MAIVQRDNVQIFLLQKEDRQIATKTSLRISVDRIEQLYEELKAKEEEIIHPEGKLETKPWGVKESTVPCLEKAGLAVDRLPRFVVIDPMGVCLTFCEPVERQ